MKTIHDYLWEVSTEKIVGSYMYYHPLDFVSIHMQGMQDMTFNEIDEAEKNRIRKIIREMKNITPAAPKDQENQMVLYAAHTLEMHAGFLGDEEEFLFCRLNEIKEDPEEAIDYDISMTPWEESLGYLVSDSPLTQFYIADAMAEYIYEAALFGNTQDGQESGVENIKKRLDESMKIQKKTFTADEMEEAMFGKEYSIQKKALKDRDRDRNISQLNEAVYDYFKKYRAIERNKILEG